MEERKYSIYNFAYCGTEDSMNRLFEYIKNIAEPEIWSLREDDPYKILRGYIFRTFERCNEQGKIEYTRNKEKCCFNTGLLTPNGKEILIIFAKNTYTEATKEWYLKEVKTTSEPEFYEEFDKVPELATFTDNPEDYWFNPELPFEMNIDHIIDDNWDRVHNELGYNREISKMLIEAAVEKSKKKAKRNIRLCLPQVHNGKIGFMMPIQIPIDKDKWCTMSIAISKTENNKYIGCTIYNLEQTIEKTRLLLHDDNSWATNTLKIGNR